VTISPDVEAAVRRVVDANLRIITSTLRTIKVPSPSYAVGLWSEDPDLLAPTVVAVGLEVTRSAILRAHSPAEAREQVWNVADFALDALPEPRSDPGFVEHKADAREGLEREGIWDPARYVLNRVAKELGRDPPIAPVTADFVVFVFDEDFADELRHNIEYSASDLALAELDRMQLLPEFSDFHS
jgi:hypothetical protein